MTKEVLALNNLRSRIIVKSRSIDDEKIRNLLEKEINGVEFTIRAAIEKIIKLNLNLEFNDSDWDREIEKGVSTWADRKKLALIYDRYRLFMVRYGRIDYYSIDQFKGKANFYGLATPMYNWLKMEEKGIQLGSKVKYRRKIYEVEGVTVDCRIQIRGSAGKVITVTFSAISLIEDNLAK